MNLVDKFYNTKLKILKINILVKNIEVYTMLFTKYKKLLNHQFKSFN